MMCSISLQQMQIKEIGLQLPGSHLSPFLKNGVTKAFF